MFVNMLFFGNIVPSQFVWRRDKAYGFRLSPNHSPHHEFSVCTGAFILGKAGLLDNLTVTTFHSAIASLRKAVPKAKVLENVRYVDNGRVITTAGISAGIDGALHLVAKLKGKDAAIKGAKHKEYDKYIPEQGMVVSRP